MFVLSEIEELPNDKLKATDTMIVNRGENSYQASVADVKSGSKLKDDDVFLLNRGENSYKITKADLESEIAPPETVNKPTLLTPANNATGLSLTALTMTCTAFAGTNS